MGQDKIVWTAAKLKNKVLRDLDLEGEDFVTTTELHGYLEDAVADAETLVHDIYEDYFLSREVIDLEEDEDSYDLPDVIYAHKIRLIQYVESGLCYTVPRMRNIEKFLDYNTARIYSETRNDRNLRYFIFNTTAGEPKITLSPIPTAANEGKLHVWFIRKANRLEEDTDILDIPEADRYIMQHVKVRCYEKEGHPNLQMALSTLEALRGQLVSTLTTMVPDENNTIPMDLSAYEDMN